MTHTPNHVYEYLFANLTSPPLPKIHLFLCRKKEVEKATLILTKRQDRQQPHPNHTSACASL